LENRAGYHESEGIEDAKYLFTLQSLIDEFRVAESRALAEKAKEAGQLLADIYARVRLPSLNSGDYNKNAAAFPVEEFDVIRWKIACKIMELTDLSGKMHDKSGGVK